MTKELSKYLNVTSFKNWGVGRLELGKVSLSTTKITLGSMTYFRSEISFKLIGKNHVTYDATYT